jgi:ketosteroid isomerase-like protein
MGEARELLDRMTKAVFSGDADALADCYAEDAMAVTPDYGEIRGPAAIVEYFRPFFEAFSDIRWEEIQRHEAGNVAIDEGFFTGTHTAPLANPGGEPIPATGKRVRLRECDVATVTGGRITSHRMYFDQMDLMNQLGLTD